MIRALPVLLLAACTSVGVGTEPCPPHCYVLRDVDGGVAVEGRCHPSYPSSESRVTFATATQAVQHVDRAGLVLCGGGR